MRKFPKESELTFECRPCNIEMVMRASLGQEHLGAGNQRAGLRLDGVSPYHCALAKISLVGRRSAEPRATGSASIDIKKRRALSTRRLAATNITRLLQLGIDLLRHFQVLPHCLSGFVGETFHVWIASVLRLLFERRQIFFMVFHHRIHVILV